MAHPSQQVLEAKVVRAPDIEQLTSTNSSPYVSIS